MHSRRLLSLPASRALVARLARDRAARRRGRAAYGFPLRHTELAYLQDRERLQERADDAARIIERTRGLSGGSSLEDDFPRGAYLALRVTRALTRAERAALAGTGLRVRVLRVARSLRSLLRVQDRIDSSALEREGIAAHSTGPDVDRNVVEVVFSSDRSDAAAVLRARHGAAVRPVRVPALSPACTTPDAYDVAADDRTLTLTYTTSGGPDPALARVQLRELPDRVEVVVVEQLPPGLAIDAVRATATTTLAAPLAGRPVVSLLTRRPLSAR